MWVCLKIGVPPIWLIYYYKLLLMDDLGYLYGLRNPHVQPWFTINESGYQLVLLLETLMDFEDSEEAPRRGVPSQLEAQRCAEVGC